LGKCRIISHDGDGLYTVQMLPDFSIIEAEIAKLTAELSDIDNVELVNLEIAYLLAKADTDNKKADADTLIDTYASDPTPEKLDAVNASIAVVGEAIIKESEAKIPYDAVKARKLAIEKRIVKLYAAIGTPSPIQIWCTDLSDGLKYRGLFDADDVAGTIELIGDDTDTTLQPHYADLGLYSSSRDGLMTPTASLTPASYFYNRAMKPGWQKWQHQYRPGIITGVSGGGGFDVTLDDVRSREQSDFIPVSNFEDRLLTEVSAEYMTCNEAGFSVSDHVIVNTQWDGIQRIDIIIGFVDNPKPCDVNGFNYHPNVIGGASPGLKDWQNIKPTWTMKTPVLSDVITDGTGPDMRDWKGYLNNGTKILAQWENRGSYIYVDGVKIATKPVFTLPAATGDTAGALVPQGFLTAWVTKDNNYLYAIPYESGKSRHVLRKTNTAELTGVAYNITTAPDGWEVSAAFGPADYTDFISFGIPYMNESGTEGRSIDNWVHGAKRTPPSDPGAGAEWLPVSSYFDAWGEESQINISSPSAATIAAAGITHQFNGLIGSIYRETWGYQNWQNFSGEFICGAFHWYAQGIRTDKGTETWSGSRAVYVGYRGDTLGYVWQNGIGNWSNEWVHSGFNEDCVGGNPVGSFSESKTTTTSIGGIGYVYTSDLDSWILPGWTTEENDTVNMSGTPCNNATYNQTWTLSRFTGGFNLANVSDGIYRYIQDEDYQVRVASYGGTSGPPNCPGNVLSSLLSTERGIIELGTTERVFERVSADISSDGPATVDPFLDLFPVMTLAYGDDPNNPTEPAGTTVKNNMTGYIVLFGTHTTHFANHQAAKDHNDNYISWSQHQYNDLLTTEYENFLTGGDLSTLDELDNGDGTQYLNPHVAN